MTSAAPPHPAAELAAWRDLLLRGVLLTALLLEILALAQGIAAPFTPAIKGALIAFAALSTGGLAGIWQSRRWGVYLLGVVKLLVLAVAMTVNAPLAQPLLGLGLFVVIFSLLPAALLRAISTDIYRRPWLSLALTLAPPLLWLLIVYIGSLAAMLLNSFFYVSTGGYALQIVREFSLQTYADLFTAAHLGVIFRTAIMAALVTLTCAAMAFPVAYMMTFYASHRTRALMYLGVLLPLWSSYLVRIYAWKLILAREGIITWGLDLVGLDGVVGWLLTLPVIRAPSLSSSPLGIFIVFVYVWLPYMILPIAAALERVPRSLLEASSDLGGRPGLTFRRVTLPLAIPGVVAGSIFTFSLTLGEFIVPRTFGDSSYYIGNVIYSYYGTSGNLPLAAAFTMVPVVIMVFYLMAAQRLGAFDAL